MNRETSITILVFLSGLLLVALIWVAVDVVLYVRGDDTISWSMALLGRSNPGVIFVLGHATGGILWGLVAHFWFGLPSPDFWDEMLRLRIENAKFKADRQAADRDPTIAVLDRDENARIKAGRP